MKTTARRTLRLTLICAFALLLPFLARPGWCAIATDVSVSTNRSSSATSITSPSFSTSSPNELLLAFVATDATSAGVTVTGVTGAGLTWNLVVRTNAQLGTSEIWRAFAPTALSNVKVQASLSQNVAASITVASFTGVNTSGSNGSGAVGATGSGNANSGTPSASLTTTANNSWVFGVGNDWDTATSRTLGTNQSMVNQYLSSTGDTFWVQRQDTTTPVAGTLVTIDDTDPSGDRYNLTTVEVLPAAPDSWSILGSISPATAGAGCNLTLSQSGSTIATVTAGANSNYSFIGLSNGTYTVTPVKSGYTFTPASQTVTVNGANANDVNFTATALPTYSISGSITPSGSGAGTLLLLSGSTNLTTTADTSGNYSFNGLPNGSFTVTPSKSEFTFSPASQGVTINGGSTTNIDFTASDNSTSSLNYPDLSDLIPPGQISIVGSGSTRTFQYTHDTFNGGSGPLVIQPVYNQASGNYQGIQYIYSYSGGVWTLAQQIPVAGAFVFDALHGHFHFPFSTYGLYASNSDGSIGAPVAVSGKVGFCIDDSFIYDPSLPNAGALGNLGSCTDPTTLRGLDIGAVDEYDQTDEGQSIVIGNLPDGTYWLRAVADPDNYLSESDKSNNETDVQLTITGNTVNVLKTVVPVLSPPPSVTLTSPAAGPVAGTVNLSANTQATGGVKFLVDGLPFGPLVTSPPYTLSWDTTTAANGGHWLAAQTTDAVSGRIGTSPVVAVNVSNSSTTDIPPTVQVTDPLQGATVSASVAVTATAADDTAVVSLQFYLDGVALGAPLTAPPYIIYWDTLNSTSGQHTITASATDTAGLVGTSAPITVTVDNSHPANVIGKEATVSVDGSGTMQTPVFSTTTPGDLLVAFVAYDGPATSAQTAFVSGAGLTWVLLKRSNVQHGTSEIWVATATDPLTNATVISQSAISGYHGSMSVIAFTNASGPGTVGQASAPSGAPDIYLPGVADGSWVFAVGNDWDNALPRMPVSGQVLVHQWLDTTTGDTYWVQSTTAPSTAYALVDIEDSVPTTDQWNYAAVEIVATRQ